MYVISTDITILHTQECMYVHTHTYAEYSFKDEFTTHKLLSMHIKELNLTH